MPFDEANQCFSPFVVGCASGWSNGETSPFCYKRTDGAIVETFLLYPNDMSPDWRSCTREDKERAANVPACR
jgi:hypothetical protein